MCTYVHTQDSSGGTPLMIASSLRDADDIVDLLLNKEADVNAKSASDFIQKPLHFFSFLPSLSPIKSQLFYREALINPPPIQTSAAKQPSTSPPPKTTSKPPANSSRTKHQPG